MHTVGVIGVGSIGSVLARGFDQVGYEVAINDADPDREAALDLPATTKADLAARSDALVLALPTPTTDEGGDYSIVDDALGALQKTDATIILRSTMPPGSTAHLADKHDLPLIYSPEFLRDRSTVEDFFHPDRMVFAGPNPHRERARELFDHPEIQCDRVIERRDYLTAELGKYAHNAFFATKVSFANQMRAIAEVEGADAQTVMDIVTADHRNTTSHLDPMLGPYGGECLPKDLGALRAYAKAEAVPTPVLDGTHEMNQLAKNTYRERDIAGTWPDITVQGD